MRIHALLLPLLLLAAACAVQTPATTRYLLPADVPAGSGRVDPPVRYGLARVSVPPYLKDLGLVVETSPGQVRPARLHEWAEPLDDGLRRFLRIEISSALGQEIGSDIAQRSRWQAAIDVDVDRLHGTLDGEAVLVARWRLSPRSGAPGDYRFAAREALTEPGYAGLVEAEVLLLRQLSRAIADSLRD
jgi:uncharacterized lipoprotein YmbA